MSYVVGIDPDLHNTGVAIILDGVVESVNVCRVPKSLKGEAAVQAMLKQLSVDLPLWLEGVSFHGVVEGQQIYYGKSKVSPDSILLLSQVAGGASAILHAICATSVTMPRPRKWKGEVPKPIHQARVLSRLGWLYKKTQGYSYPTNPPSRLNKLRPDEWKHVVDALGLAMWGAERQPI